MALEAFVRVSYRFAKSGQGNTVAENLIGPCAQHITKYMFRENVTNKTIQCREELMIWQMMWKMSFLKE